MGGAFGFLPAAVNPKPIGRVTADRGLQRPVDVPHDVLARPRYPTLMRWDLFTDFQSPFRQFNPMADNGEKLAIITQSEHGGCKAGVAVVAEELRTQSD